MKKRNSLWGYLALFLAATIWGSTFVAQAVGMDYIEPFTFSAVRSIIGAAFLVPVTIICRKSSVSRGFIPTNEKNEEISFKEYNRNSLIGGICCGIVLCIAANFQQFGIAGSTVGKSGFITALYVVLVPVFGLILKKKASPFIWLGVALSVGGLYLLCINEENFSIGFPEIQLLLCAVFFTFHIMVIDHFTYKADPVMLSCVQFFVNAVVSTILMFVFETPDIATIKPAMGSILYAAVFSSGIAYTLQIVGQKRTDPTIASLIMCLESVVAVLSGFLFRGEILSNREIIGCALMFGAILIAQIPANKPKLKEDTSK